MKKICYILFFFACFSSSYSQTYDLIVMKNGDSLACNIDIINDNKIYFNTLSHGNWVQTHIDLQDVAEYQFNTLEADRVVFYDNHLRIKDILLREDADRIKNAFQHRYLFSPSALPVNKKDFYYNSYYFLIHDFHYGFGNHFSSRFGTSILFFPYYILPQYSFRISDESSFALGDLFLFMPFGEFAMGNLAYGMYTAGAPNKNISLGAGVWSTNESKIADNGNYPAVTLSVKLPVSYNVQFISENYFFQMDMMHLAQKEPYTPIIEEWFSYRHTYVFGLSGFRIIRRINKTSSWDIALLYIYIHQDKDIPEIYDVGWTVDSRNNKVNTFLVIPTISYSRKFNRTK